MMSTRGPYFLALSLASFATILLPERADAQCAVSPSCPPCTLCRAPPAMGANPPAATLATLFDQIAAGPAVYGTLGWNLGSARSMSSGSGWCSAGVGPRSTIATHFPCVLLKSIFMTESSWRQFCASGLTQIAFDCGYGIAQVTTGMRPGNTSAFDPNRVAAEPAYNVSVGAAILAGKWPIGPCVGANDPDVIEHWYFATWGYNGFAFKNNPNNPMYSASRVEFRTPGVASAQVRSNYPYQELVWGYVHYPPTANHWTGIALGYPSRSEICASCGLPTADVSEPATVHRSDCPVAVDAGADGGDAAGDGPVADATDALGDVASADGADASGRGGMRSGCGCRVPAGQRGAGTGLALGTAVAVGAALRKRRHSPRPGRRA